MTTNPITLNFSLFSARVSQSALITTWGSLLLKLLGFAALLPLVLNKFSPEDASLWLLFNSISGLINLADFGFAPTFIRAIAYVSKEKSDKYPRNNLSEVIGTMSRIYWGIAILALVLGGTVGSLSLVEPIAQTGNHMCGWLAWFIVLISMSLNLHWGMYAVYLQGNERISDFRKWEIFSGFITLILSILTVQFGGGILGLILVSQAGLCVNSAVNRHLSTHSIHDKKIWELSGSFSRKVWEGVWGPAWRSGVGVLLTFGTIQCSSIIYAQLAKPSEAGTYLLSMRLVQTLVTLANVPFYTKLPTMARLYAENKLSELVKIARKGMLVTNWVLILGIMIIGLWANFILDVMGSKTKFVDSQIWWILGLAYLIERIGAMHLQLYTTTNHVIWHVLNGISGAQMLVFMPVFFTKWGVLGFPLGILISYLTFYTPFSIFRCYKTFKMRLSLSDIMALVFPVLILIFCVLVL